MSIGTGFLLTVAKIRLAPAKNEKLGSLRLGNHWNWQLIADGNCSVGAADYHHYEGEVTIVAKAWPGSPFETESILAAIDQFHEENPNYTVDWQTEPESYGQKVLTQIAAGTPPDTM